VGAIIEAKYNDKDEIMKWPFAVSPYDIAIIPLISKNETLNIERANSVYNFLKEKNIDVILDDTEENFSSKIKKFNLIGIPYQILIGKKSDGDLLEFKEIGNEAQHLPLNQIANLIIKQKSKI
jgi:prolyl-tRNA synthetase